MLTLDFKCYMYTIGNRGPGKSFKYQTFVTMATVCPSYSFKIHIANIFTDFYMKLILILLQQDIL